MIGLVCFLAIVGATVARQAGHGHYNNYCYQCEYGPPQRHERTEIDVIEYQEKIPHTKVHCWYSYEYQGEDNEAADRPDADCSYHTPQCEYETTYEINVKTREVPRVVAYYTNSTGFKHCAGPIDHDYAIKYGVDIWECHGNCYLRVGGDNQISRGCYNHEIGVNQNLFGCYDQSGSHYCFCQGKECNGQDYRDVVGYQ